MAHGLWLWLGPGLVAMSATRGSRPAPVNAGRPSIHQRLPGTRRLLLCSPCRKQPDNNSILTILRPDCETYFSACICFAPAPLPLLFVFSSSFFPTSRFFVSHTRA